MRIFALTAALAVAAASCSEKPLKTVKYADASGDFTAEYPEGWTISDGPSLIPRPVARVTFGGEVTGKEGEASVGTAIHVTRVTRLQQEMPTEQEKLLGFMGLWLTPSNVLFGMHPKVLDEHTRADLPDMRETTVDGKKARAYERDFTVTTPDGAVVSMRLTDTVAQTPNAYYIIEYAAPRASFERDMPKYDKFLSTFTFGPGA